MSDLITIIVPVYNGEKYIQKCLDSILQQTYDNYEILIVNDGSTDETLKIATQYEQKYENIRIVTKENQGLPQARKTGVENANGSYIGFVDVDDWIDPDMFEVLHTLCIEKGTQIAACGMVFEFGTKGIPQFKDEEHVCVYNNLEALEQLNQRKDVKVYVWNKLYAKEVFKDVVFAKDNFIGEDYDLVTKVLCKELTVAWTARCMYHYLQADGTMSHSAFSHQHKISYENYKRRCAALSEQFPQYTSLFDNYVLTEYIMFVVAMSRNRNYDKDILNEIKAFVKKCKKQYCKADYIEAKFKISVRMFCIHYRLFILGYRTMETMRYLLLK